VAIVRAGVWSSWWAGRSTQNLYVLGLSMLWWGRIGKYLQFLGGLTVVLDIVGPERLRSIGAQGKARRDQEIERRGQERDAFKAWRLRVLPIKVMRAIAPPVARLGNADPVTWKIGRKPFKVPKAATFTLPELLELRSLFIAGRHLHHPGHMDHESVCEEQHRYLAALVDEFMDAHTSAEDADLMRRAEAPKIFQRFQWAVLGMAGIVVAWFLAALILSTFDASLSVAALRVFIAALIVYAFLVPMILFPGALTFIWLYIRYTPVQAVTNMLARLLDNASPGHSLRWAALVLIVLGFHLDLLSA
jgi:hypothetical protein